ncbi:hypothetical protein C4D60_Mb01t08840 [Musa balbisiana]|uniref:Uncharacterized protein n=1 Tax=Musa balbisiana TaxID=52838 RepID=A0A4S8JM73_MUSBA|nr:hypothetical protein C4D60_Mb01t08840 [Musa balbisiana]
MSRTGPNPIGHWSELFSDTHCGPCERKDVSLRKRKKRSAQVICLPWPNPHEHHYSCRPTLYPNLRESNTSPSSHGWQTWRWPSSLCRCSCAVAGRGATAEAPRLSASKQQGVAIVALVQEHFVKHLEDV